MYDDEIKELQRVAEQLGRHLDTVGFAMLSLTVVLSSAGAAVVTRFDNPSATGFDGAVIFMPMLAAFLFTLMAIGQRTLLVPDPDTATQNETEQSDSKYGAIVRTCLDDAVERNGIRNLALIGAISTILIAVVTFFWWLSEHDPARDLTISRETAADDVLDLPEPNEILKIELRSDTVGECEVTEVLIPDELTQLEFVTCPYNLSTSRAIGSVILMLFSLALCLAFAAWLKWRPRHETLSDARDSGLIIDLEQRPKLVRRRAERRSRSSGDNADGGSPGGSSDVGQ